MKKILVIGDGCRDVFVYCETQRLAPDVPVPVLNVVHQVENPALDKAEELLSMFEPFAKYLMSEEYQRFREICSEVADLRDPQ
jgi:hypothetical protein